MWSKSIASETIQNTSLTPVNAYASRQSFGTAFTDQGDLFQCYIGKD